MTRPSSEPPHSPIEFTYLGTDFRVVFNPNSPLDPNGSWVVYADRVVCWSFPFMPDLHDEALVTLWVMDWWHERDPNNQAREFSLRYPDMALALDHTIKTPMSRTLPVPSPTLVVPSSPPSWRRAVEQLARYFQRELHHDVVPFDASEDPAWEGSPPYEAWLFHDFALEAWHNHDEFPPRRAVGAACFRALGDDEHGPSWTLDFVWFHPYARRKGLLGAAWPMFRARYGAIAIAGPLSPAMEGFLRKLAADVRGVHARSTPPVVAPMRTKIGVASRYQTGNPPALKPVNTTIGYETGVPPAPKTSNAAIGMHAQIPRDRPSPG